jgi:RNA polymerase sigma factor (sigma-70 family)
MPDSSRAGFQSLLFRALNGDRDALNELLDEYSPQLLAYINRGLSPPGPTVGKSDILQSAVRRFLNRNRRKRCSIESPEKFLALLKKIAANTNKQKRRDLKAAKRVGNLVRERMDEQLVPDDTPGPSTCLANNEDRELRERDIERILAVLPERARRCLVGLGAGKSWKELAAQEGVDADTLRMSCYRARDKARRKLGL